MVCLTASDGVKWLLCMSSDTFCHGICNKYPSLVKEISETPTGRGSLAHSRDSMQENDASSP